MSDRGRAHPDGRYWAGVNPRLRGIFSWQHGDDPRAAFRGRFETIEEAEAAAVLGTEKWWRRKMVNEIQCAYCGLQKAHPCKTADAAKKCRPAEEVAVRALYAHSPVEIDTPRARLSQQAIVRSLGQNTVIVAQDVPEARDQLLWDLREGCNALVMQALPGGAIPFEVWQVVHDALSKGIPVYELDRGAEICVTVDRLSPARCLTRDVSRLVEGALATQARGE